MAKQKQRQQRPQKQQPLSPDYLQEVRERIRTGSDELYYQLGVPNPHIPSIMQLGIEDAPQLLREVERLLAEVERLREESAYLQRGIDKILHEQPNFHWHE